MAKLAVTVAGGVVGGLIGGPLGAQIGMTLGGALGSSLFGPTTHGPRLDDLTITTSTYGNAIPEVYGTTRISGNLIWSAGIKEKKKKSGGKGGPKQVSYSYSASFAIAICKGEIDDILRIWGDSKLIYGDTPAKQKNIGGGNVFGMFRSEGSKKKVKYNFRIYKGDEDQLPDSIIQADVGANRTPGYRGMAYVVFEDLPLEDFGNRIPSFSFEVTKAALRVAPKETFEYNGGGRVGRLGNHFVDWAANKYIHYRNGIATVFNLSTMTEVGRYSTDLPTARLSFSQNGGPIYAEKGSHNSRKVVVYDSKTFSNIHESGILSTRVAALPIAFCSGAMPWYGALQHFGNCIVYSASGSRTDYRFSVTWRYDFQIYLGATCVYFSRDMSPVKSFVQGFTGQGESDMILFRNSSPTASIHRFTVYAGAVGNYSSAPAYYWEQCNGFGAGATFVSSGDVLNYGEIRLYPYGREFSATLGIYDPTDDTMFFLGKFKDNNKRGAFKYHVRENRYKWIKEYSESFPLPQSNMKNSRLQGGTFGWIGVPYSYSTAAYTIDLQSGAFEKHGGNFGVFKDSFFGYGDQHWDDKTQSLVSADFHGMSRYYFRESSSEVTVGSIVSDVFRRTGVLTPLDYDTSEIDDIPVKGYTITRESSARDILGQLATVYLFDGVESDYKIKIKKRGGTPNVTIDESWLGHISDRDVQIRETRAQELELPMRVSLVYLEYDRDYQAGTQFSKRNVNPVPTMHSLREEKVEVPIVLDADEAKQFTDKALKAAWAGRSSYELKLPWKFLKYDPADVALVNLDDGTSYRMRLNEFTIGADLTIELGATSERAAAYVSNVEADGGTGVPIQYAALSDPAHPVIMNVPLIRDLDDTQGRASITYISAYADSGRFRGARLHMSSNGVDYDALTYIGSDITTGLCINGLPPTKSYAGTDRTTELIVKLSDPSMELESVTDEEMLTEYKNAAVIGGIEVIQFRDAELLDDGTYKLTNILRARRGTNYSVNLHVNTGESFVLLEEEGVAITERPPEFFDTGRYFKAVPPGELSEDSDPHYKNLLPIDLMPYTPEHVEVTDDGVNITVSFVRRSRITAPLLAYSDDVPNKEGTTTPKAKWEVWNGRALNSMTMDHSPGKDPLYQIWDQGIADTVGEVDFPIDGADKDRASFQFPLSDVLTGEPGDQETFLLRVRENGYVPGIPKIVEARYVDTGRWNIRALY